MAQQSINPLRQPLPLTAGDMREIVREALTDWMRRTRMPHDIGSCEVTDSDIYTMIAISNTLTNDNEDKINSWLKGNRE